MQLRTASCGVALTELGLGAAQLGNLYRQTSESESRETVEAAWDAGIRYFDTAPHYGLGLSERRLGEQLSGHPRAEYVISTKVGRLLRPSPETSAQSDSEGFAVPASYRREWDFSRDGILRSVEESLARTGLDRFDILYLHDPDEHFEQASTEGIAALIELREQGVVSAVGAGMNHAAPLAELIRRADIDLVMCAGRFTLLDSEALVELLPLATARDVGVVVAGVFNSGLLSRGRPLPNARFDYQQAPAALIDRVHRIADRCEAYGMTLPEVAIAYVLRHAAVASVLVGARGKQQVDDNVERSQTTVPDLLWSELAFEGLIQEFPI
jgi:D-threo-aldose 1-dehydrogenase